MRIPDLYLNYELMLKIDFDKSFCTRFGLSIFNNICYGNYFFINSINNFLNNMFVILYAGTIFIKLSSSYEHNNKVINIILSVVLNDSMRFIIDKANGQI